MCGPTHTPEPFTRSRQSAGFTFEVLGVGLGVVLLESLFVLAGLAVVALSLRGQ